jgi:putative hemolysin
VVVAVAVAVAVAVVAVVSVVAVVVVALDATVRRRHVTLVQSLRRTPRSSASTMTTSSVLFTCRTVTACVGHRLPSMGCLELSVGSTKVTKHVQATSWVLVLHDSPHQPCALHPHRADPAHTGPANGHSTYCSQFPSAGGWGQRAQQTLTQAHRAGEVRVCVE